MGAGLPELWLLCGMLKGEKHDLVIQKATEAGRGGDHQRGLSAQHSALSGRAGR